MQEAVDKGSMKVTTDRHRYGGVGPEGLRFRALGPAGFGFQVLELGLNFPALRVVSLYRH